MLLEPFINPRFQPPPQRHLPAMTPTIWFLPISERQNSKTQFQFKSICPTQKNDHPRRPTPLHPRLVPGVERVPKIGFCGCAGEEIESGWATEWSGGGIGRFDSGGGETRQFVWLSAPPLLRLVRHCLEPRGARLFQKSNP